MERAITFDYKISELLRYISSLLLHTYYHCCIIIGTVDKYEKENDVIVTQNKYAPKTNGEIYTSARNISSIRW